MNTKAHNDVMCLGKGKCFTVEAPLAQANTLLVKNETSTGIEIHSVSTEATSN